MKVYFSFYGSLLILTMSPPKLHKFTLIVSFIIGIITAICWKHYRSYQVTEMLMQSFVPSSLSSLSSSSIGISLDEDTDNNLTISLPPQKKDKILCIILTNNRRSSRAIKLTWGSQCDSVRFYGYSNFNDSSIPVSTISRTSVVSFSDFCSIIFDLNHDLFHWIMLADDDTYVIVENLRRLLYKFDHNNLVYLGRSIRAYAQLPYNTRDSGIVVSVEAFKFIQKSVIDMVTCKTHRYPLIGNVDRRTDIALAMILKKANCTPIDTRDQFGGARFLPLNPEKHLSPIRSNAIGPFWRYNIYPMLQGPNCCSKTLITMPQITSTRIYFFHYLLHFVNIK